MLGFMINADNVTSRYKRPEDARMALEQMEGFELAGRTVSANRPSSHSCFKRFMCMCSFVSRQCMKKVLLGCNSRTVWMKQAVRPFCFEYI